MQRPWLSRHCGSQQAATPTKENIMDKFAAKIRSAARWYMESCSHVDPAAAVAMFGTGIVAIPMTPGANPGEGAR